MATTSIQNTDIHRRDGFQSLPLAAIIGIVVGATLVFCSVLGAFLFVYLLKRSHRQQARRISTSNNHGQAEMDIKTALRCTPPPLVRNLSNRTPHNSFMPLGEVNLAQEWADHDMPQPLKAKRTMSQRSFFLISAVRDSWPLASSMASNNRIPLAILPKQSTMVLSPVAPPGYVIEDRGPNRSSSRLSRRKSAISVNTTRSQSPTITKRRGSADNSPSHSPSKSPKRSTRRSPGKDMFGPSNPPLKRRATSETQLSDILRSTSQRIKAAHRQSLTRSFTTIGKFPGAPPQSRLPTPPRGMKTESREELIDREYSESLRSSFINSYINRTPSPDKDIKVTFEDPVYQPRSPTPSSGSGDSLCIRKKTDVVIPTILKSPSKSLRGEKRQDTEVLSNNTTGVGSRASKDLKIVIPEHGNSVSRPKIGGEFGSSPTILLANDPFYSSAQTSESVIPPARVLGPRPMFTKDRKATFGQPALSYQLPPSSNPLKESTGNAQSLPKQRSCSPASSPERSAESIQSERNPFQWTAQELSPRSRPGSTSSTHGRNRGRGHKRSNVVRISVSRPSSRPQSIVETIDEENVQPVLKFNLPKSVARLSAPPKSPTRSSSNVASRKLVSRPPSSLKFEPIITIPDLSPRSVDGPMLGQEDSHYPSAYNSEEGRDCGPMDSFFNTRPLTLTKRPSSDQKYSEVVAKSGERQSHKRNRSSGILIYPDHDPQYGEELMFISFPPLKLTDHPTPVLSPPSSTGARALPNITTSMISMAGTAIPAPPLLTTLLPPKASSSDTTLDRTLLLPESSPPRTSLHASINALGRMNSDVSTQCSTLSVHCIEDSPNLSSRAPSRTDSPALLRIDETVNQPTELERGRSRGSKNYLSMGSQASQIPFNSSGITIPQNFAQVANARRSRNRERSTTRQPRDSHGVHKERSRKRFGSAEIEDVEDESDNFLTSHKDRRGNRGMDWEFDGADRGGGMSDWDTELTPVKEDTSLSNGKGNGERRKSSEEVLTRSNALGIKGLRYSTMDFETDRAGVHGGIDGVSSSHLHREIAAAKRDLDSSPSRRGKSGKSPLGFGFEAFRPALGRAPSLRLSGQHVSVESEAETLSPVKEKEKGRWSDMMEKPNANATRRESKMEQPQAQNRWSLSGMVLATAAAARLYGGGGGIPQQTSFATVKSGVRVVEEVKQDKALRKIKSHVERPESLGLYDQDGFLLGSPGRGKSVKEKKERDGEGERLERERRSGGVEREEVSRSEVKRMSGYVM